MIGFFPWTFHKSCEMISALVVISKHFCQLPQKQLLLSELQVYFRRAPASALRVTCKCFMYLELLNHGRPFYELMFAELELFLQMT